MKLAQLLLLSTLFYLELCELILHNDQENGTKPVNIQIQRINMQGERWYMTVSSKIHGNRSRFDIYVNMHRELGSNYIIMNIRLRAKFENTNYFQPVFEFKRLDFCAFLTEYKENAVMQLFFKKSIQLSDYIVCPLRVGNYSVVNIGVADNVYPENLQKGTYKFFVELVEGTGEIPKIFAMQVISSM